MKEALRNRPFYVFLLPVFFVWHGFVELWAFHNITDYLPLLLVYLCSSALLLGVCRLIFRNWRKAGLFTVWLTGFYFFFGAIFDFLKQHSPVQFLYKYTVLTGLFLVLAIVIFIWLKRTSNHLFRITFFLNLLLLIYIGIDIFIAIKKSGKKEHQIQMSMPNAANGIIPDSCKKPDIFLLVFDGYSSTYGLQQLFSYDNRNMDSFLLSRKFHNFSASRSNYNATIFSMASQLNMDYLWWLDSKKWMTKKDYTLGTARIYNNEVMEFLRKNGYIIRNHSIFDLREHPSYADQEFRTIHTNILAEGSFGSRVLWQFRWLFEGDRILKKLLPFVEYQEQFLTTQQQLEAITKEATTQSNQPRFVYAHLLMPHFPYYRDKDGNDRMAHKWTDPEWDPHPDNPYTSYLQYTNGIIRNLIDSIQSASGGNAAIIVESDHGFHKDCPPEKAGLVWNNLNAVYLPHQPYSAFSDSITNVNEFRLIFNTLFHQQYPMLKDSLVRILH